MQARSSADCRRTSQAIYATSRTSADLTLKDPPVFHESLSSVHAWKYAQLLSILPKREAEVEEWSLRARKLGEVTFKNRLPHYLGSLDSYGHNSRGEGVFVDVSSRTALPCWRSLISGRR